MGSVMIVDDSVDIRRMLRAVVADVADPIYECRDGGEACAAYGTHRPDWVLMDISMTPMDGMVATRQIVERFPAARIVIVTQYDDARLRIAAERAGACGYVLKNNLLDVRRFLEAPAR
jgi:DNA-binding NarL/FixJ family response regulator